jgi:Ca2+-binding EF-hand superfamily protein
MLYFSFSFFLSFTDMKQAFDLFDKNNDGKISSDELGRVLRTLGHNYSNEEVQEMISNVDTNGRYDARKSLWRLMFITEVI